MCEVIVVGIEKSVAEVVDCPRVVCTGTGDGTATCKT